MVKSEIPDINNNTVIESIELEFFENIFLFKEERYNGGDSKRKYEASFSKGQVNQETEVETRMSKRVKKSYFLWTRFSNLHVRR